MRFNLIWVVAALTLLTPTLARAEESDERASPHTQWQLDSTIYTEFGNEIFGEGDGVEHYRESAIGAGLLGTLRLGANGGTTPSGTALFVGVTQEFSSLTLTRCGEFCEAPQVTAGTFGARAGVGWDFHWLGVRVGVDALSSKAFGVGTIVVPDLALRLGALDDGYFLLGFGSYDAQTTVRPGAYIGGGFALGSGFSTVIHGGVHLDQDWWVFRGDATLEYRLSHALSLGLGGAVQTLSGETAYQGHVSLSVGQFN